VVCPHFGKEKCDEHCIAYVSAHEAGDTFAEMEGEYSSEMALDFIIFCDTNDELVKLSAKTWANIRKRIVDLQRTAYVSGFFHGWERLDYEQATLDWLDGSEE